jgi:methionyl-tRNA formyltransferase
MLDILAFRIYYRVRLAAKDHSWHERTVAAMRERWPEVPSSIPVLDVSSPNSAESEKFIRGCAPDVTLALSKHLLAARIFEIPRAGTFVCHAGVTPEYRNAHGCFWAMVKGDFEKVGMTLLRIDRGVDTGPVFGYFSYPYDPRSESHIEIQHRVVLDNLDAIADTLERIVAGDASPIPVDGRSSGAWGQPHISAYLRLRKHLRRSDAFPRSRVS